MDPVSPRGPLNAIPEFFALQPDALGSWADASNMRLALHVEGSCCKLAVANHNEMAVFAAPCKTAWQHGAATPRPHQAATLLLASTCPDTITDLAWITLRPPPRSPAAPPMGAQAGTGHAPDTRSSSESGSSTSHQAAPRLPHGGSGKAPPRSHGDFIDPLPGPALAADGCPPPSSSSTYLLAGTSAGYLQVHTASGRLLLRQRLHTSAVQRIQLRSALMGISPGPDQEDITLTFPDSIARISCLDLQSTLAATQEDPTTSSEAAGSAASGSWFGSSVHSTQASKGRGKLPAVGPVPFQRWDLPRGTRCCLEAVCMGLKPQDLYSALQGQRPGRGDLEHKLLFAAGGEAPVLFSLEAKARAARGTLAMLQGLVSSLTSATSSAVGMARAAGARAVNTPAHLAAGLRSYVLAPLLFMSSPVPAPEPSGSAAPAVATFDDVPTASQSRVDAASLCMSLRDEQRVVTCLVPAPRGPLLAAVDTLGRLLLLDGVHITILRVWKGYRDAQCAWMEVPGCRVRSRLERLQQRHAAASASTGSGEQENVPSSRERPAQSGPLHTARGCCADGADGAADAEACTACHCGRRPLLAVYIPRRQLVEVWEAHAGTRLLALTQVGPHCRLLAARQVAASASGHEALEEQQACGSCLAPGPACCFLLDGAQGAITDVGALV